MEKKNKVKMSQVWAETFNLYHWRKKYPFASNNLVIYATSLLKGAGLRLGYTGCIAFCFLAVISH